LYPRARSDGTLPKPPAGNAPASRVPKKKCRLEIPSYAIAVYTSHVCGLITVVPDGMPIVNHDEVPVRDAVESVESD